MKPHKWAKEIKAWADGAEIEFRDPLQGWVECKNPSWTEAAIYRIKPQPKEPQYLYVYFNEQSQTFDFDVIACDLGRLKYIGKIKLENEDES